MVNRSKAKGTAAESKLVGWLREWWPAAERRALNGNVDRGDVAGIAGVAVEVKDCVKLELSAWLKETQVEQANDGADYGVLLVKRRGYGDPGDWYFVMTAAEGFRLLRQGGY